MNVFVCGLSKSGKSSLIDRCSDHGSMSFKHLKISKLLNDIGRPIQNLSFQDAIANQVTVLPIILDSIIASTAPIVIDGHLLIETIDGPQIVQDYFLINLPITGIIFVCDDPALISERRSGSELWIPAEEANDLMKIELAAAQRMARRCSVELAQLKSADTEGFMEVLPRMIYDL